MKTYYNMYVNGCPVGKWTLWKEGTFFRNRKWYNLELATRLALDFFKDGKEVLIQGWQGESLVYEKEWEKCTS